MFNVNIVIDERFVPKGITSKCEKHKLSVGILNIGIVRLFSCD